MADDDNRIAPSEGTSDEKGTQDKGKSTPQEDWKEITGGKYKSEAELAKAYKEAEKKLGEQAETIKKSDEFAQVMTPLLEEIRNDPEVFNKLDEKLRKRGQPDDKADKGQAKADDKGTGELRAVASDQIIARFEDRYGITQLPPEERKILRQTIGDAIYDLTGNKVDGIDLRRLPTILEHAYLIANKEKLIEKSKLEALASAKGVDQAAIGALSSSEHKGEETLTSEEARVAERLGLTREQYLEGKKKS